MIDPLPGATSRRTFVAGAVAAVAAGATSTGYNKVLNIDPGVVIYAEGGPSFMAVNRGNQLNAVGTPTAPMNRLA